MPVIWVVAALLNFSVAIGGGDKWYLWAIAGVAYLCIAMLTKKRKA